MSLVMRKGRWVPLGVVVVMVFAYLSCASSAMAEDAQDVQQNGLQVLTLNLLFSQSDVSEEQAEQTPAAKPVEWAENSVQAGSAMAMGLIRGILPKQTPVDNTVSTVQEKSIGGLISDLLVFRWSGDNNAELITENNSLVQTVKTPVPNVRFGSPVQTGDNLTKGAISTEILSNYTFGDDKLTAQDFTKVQQKFEAEFIKLIDGDNYQAAQNKASEFYTNYETDIHLWKQANEIIDYHFTKQMDYINYLSNIVDNSGNERLMRNVAMWQNGEAAIHSYSVRTNDHNLKLLGAVRTQESLRNFISGSKNDWATLTQNTDFLKAEAGYMKTFIDVARKPYEPSAQHYTDLTQALAYSNGLADLGALMASEDQPLVPGMKVGYLEAVKKAFISIEEYNHKTTITKINEPLYQEKLAAESGHYLSILKNLQPQQINKKTLEQNFNIDITDPSYRYTDLLSLLMGQQGRMQNVRMTYKKFDNFLEAPINSPTRINGQRIHDRINAMTDVDQTKFGFSENYFKDSRVIVDK